MYEEGCQEVTAYPCCATVFHDFLTTKNDVGLTASFISGLVQLPSVLKVLKVLKVDEEVDKGTIRFSLGRYTTKEEIDEAVRWLRKRG